MLAGSFDLLWQPCDAVMHLLLLAIDGLELNIAVAWSARLRS